MPASIQIRLFATLGRYAPPGGDRLEIPSGATVGEVLHLLGIPEDAVRLIFVDGLRGELSSILRGGERLGLFPAVGGG